jgi:hypothetical protein
MRIIVTVFERTDRMRTADVTRGEANLKNIKLSLTKKI